MVGLRVAKTHYCLKTSATLQWRRKALSHHNTFVIATDGEKIPAFAESWSENMLMGKNVRMPFRCNTRLRPATQRSN